MNGLYVFHRNKTTISAEENIIVNMNNVEYITRVNNGDNRICIQFVDGDVIFVGENAPHEFTTWRNYVSVFS